MPRLPEPLKNHPSGPLNFPPTRQIQPLTNPSLARFPINIWTWIFTAFHVAFSAPCFPRRSYQGGKCITFVFNSTVLALFCSSWVQIFFHVSQTIEGKMPATNSSTVTSRAKGDSPSPSPAPAAAEGADKSHDFFWTYTEEPHRTRRLAIIKAHPEVRALLVGPAVS